MRRQFPDFLLAIDFDLIHGVDRKNLIRIDGDQNGTRISVDDILVVTDQQISVNANFNQRLVVSLT